MARSAGARLRRLHESILTIAEGMDSFHAVASHEGGGGTIRYVSPRGSEATLEVRPERISVTTRSSDQHPDAGNTTIVDELGIDLSRGYDWNDVSCDSASELADLIVKHLLRRTREADPEPVVDRAG